MNDFLPTASLENLARRSKLVQDIHAFFQNRGFIHVETPILSRDTVVDRHIEPISIPKSTVTGQPAQTETSSMYLQTSPEFSMKRLLAAGATAIYQISRCFRQGESGRRHNPEFSMLEWYRVGDDFQLGMQLLSDFAEMALDRGPSQLVSYRDVFQKHAGVDPFDASVLDLIDCCRGHGLATAAFRDEAEPEFWLNLLLSEVVEPKLGIRQPTIVFDWPASQAALAKVRQEGDNHVAERFELYVDSVELANGYHELTDANELRVRNTAVNQQRMRDRHRPLPTDSRLLDAMDAGLPPCAGVAVGLDRLVMVAIGAQSIDEVIAFPLNRA